MVTLSILILLAVLVHGWYFWKSRRRISLEKFLLLQQKIHKFPTAELVTEYFKLQEKFSKKTLSPSEEVLFHLLEEEMIARKFLPKSIHQI